MVERHGDILVPSVVIKRGLLDFGMYFFDGGHDHCPEVFRFEDHDFIVILLALFMICSLTKQVGFLICHSWFVVKREVILG